MVQSMLKAVTHMGSKDLTLRHLKVLIGVELMLLVSRSKKNPSAPEIASLIGVPVEEFESELRDLVNLRYLFEVIPTYGPLIMRYKLGSLGGTLMRQVLPRVQSGAPADAVD